MEKQNTGFTLIEILLVIGVGAALFLGSWLSIGQIQGQSRARSAGDELRSMLRWAREMSVAEKGGTRYRVREINGVVIVENLEGVEKNRYQLPSDTSVLPVGFLYEFASVKGEASGCPCQIEINSGEAQELVLIGELGIIR